MNELATRGVLTRPATAGDLSRGLTEKLAALAGLGHGACSAVLCALAWSGVDGEGRVLAPSSPRNQASAAAILRILAPRFDKLERDAPQLLRLSAPEISSLFGNGDDRIEAAAARAVRDGVEVTAVTIVPAGGPAAELNALTRLLADSALGVISAGGQLASRDFWQRRASGTAERLVSAKSRNQRLAAESRRLDRAVAAAVKLNPRRRFTGLGALLAATGPFEAWMIAVSGDTGLAIAAASAALTPLPPLDQHSALSESFRRQSTIRRRPAPDRAPTYHEDVLFGRFPEWVCVPLASGALALASREPLDDETVARIETLVARLDPIIRNRVLEAELERLRGLVRSLGLRMFSAMDAERARIARDLHDDQAQLLAATRLALDAGPDEARAIFKQLEEALRHRVRELKPAALGRLNLGQALKIELRRLTDTGIRTRLKQSPSADSIPRAIQEVCYQVAREALSNVIRHSHASRVEVAIESRGGRVRLSVSDDGRGISNDGEAASGKRGGGSAPGLGLRGLEERVEMLGGRVRIDSRPGSTRVIAEIPEPE